MSQHVFLLLDGPATSEHGLQVIILCGVFVALLVIGFVVVSWVRKRLKTADEPVGVGFTLSDLRKLHKQGQMSAEEFEKAKGAMLLAEGRKAAHANARDEMRPPGSG